MYLYYFFQLISPLFFPPLFWPPTLLPTPEVAGGTLPAFGFAESLYNLLFDNKQTSELAQPGVKLTLKAVGLLFASHHWVLG